MENEGNCPLLFWKITDPIKVSHDQPTGPDLDTDGVLKHS